MKTYKVVYDDHNEHKVARGEAEFIGDFLKVILSDGKELYIAKHNVTFMREL